MTADLAAWRAHRSGVSTVDELVSVLAVERVSVTTFTGHSTTVPARRVFGGQILAQCAVAAAQTVAPPAALHSMHAYFVRAGRPGVKLHFEVTTLRDGRSFAARRVDAVQDNEIVTSMSASYHVPEEGLAHQDPMPARPAPADLPARTPFHVAADGPARAGAVDLRAVPPGGDEPESSVWLRITAPLPDDALLHQAMLIYLSDFSILHGAFRHHGVARSQVRTASLDHSMWLHRPGRADDWLLYESRSPSAAGARAMGQAALFTAEGTLLATASQEMLVRPVPH
ncbi:acyl-CoA thioesterase [Actinophytocola algeriensis]|uniref:Acyl-CoA thioesterase-2 n=1 Tax=Actinophytocola algeriensis TaxID=1768010 RepID=A0A7W7VD98_9PSEU|nr:acyl-CoA thioesterase domain-containing protein [Actinophytocola algeriensis]MBB4905937.1 acyl-CoA thioesterase-2 [Actinophytocola algeriensis]MBE1472378.1 acyl-CoA thioesterase-2 [Actinophytocola algeriensis]